jgi:hypothetical protein
VPTVTLSVTGCGSDETVWCAALPAGRGGRGGWRGGDGAAPGGCDDGS